MNEEHNFVEAGGPPEPLISALRRVLVSLVRLLLNFGVVFPQLVELLKSAYVEVAEQEFKLIDKPQTDTRISLLTGIHRKDIKRLRSQLSQGVEEPLGVSQGVRIVARWLGEEQYQDEKGQPLALPFKSLEGANFETLVEEVCRKDLRPRVILDEWLRLGVVNMDDDKRLLLNVNAFVPSQGIEEKSFFLGMNISDHLDAATHNLLGKKPPFFDRCVYYDELSDESIAELRELTEAKSMESLKALNERALALKERDKKLGVGKQRINVGIYAFHENNSKDGE